MGIEEKYFMELRPGALADPWAGPPVTAEQWSADIRRLLEKIETTKVGRILLESIQRYRRWVLIQPFWWVNFKAKNPCNSSATLVYVKAQGRWIYSVVKISPERYAAGSACAVHAMRSGGAIAEPHEILFHELVHAYRHVAESPVKLSLGGGLKGHTDFEEFIAVLVTNIYASANGKKVLRRDHRGHKALQDRFEDSFRFFELSRMAYPLVDEFCRTNSVFCLLLSTVKAPFNPIRAYYEDTNRARRHSDSARAARRDGGDMSVILQRMMWDIWGREVTGIKAEF
jgi:hypothetical protein